VLCHRNCRRETVRSAADYDRIVRVRFGHAERFLKFFLSITGYS
jgi:hypothetical protein